MACAINTCETERPNAQSSRLRLVIRGAVQGVGFRPFVHRLAGTFALGGWVNNSAQGVVIEVEGPKAKLEYFLVRLRSDKPPQSSIQSLEPTWLTATGDARTVDIRPPAPLHE